MIPTLPLRRPAMPETRISTSVRNLDERMNGGIPAGAIVLLCGRAGTMKSSLAFSILHNAATRGGQRGIYITLEQSRESLLEHMARLGKDPKAIEGSGGIVIVDMARLRKETGLEEGTPIDWPQAILTTVTNYKVKFGCNVAVLDSLAALYALSTFPNPRNDVFLFFDKLRAIGVTALVISEMLEPDKLLFGQYGVEDFLADGIFHLEMQRDERNVNLYLSVVKMRSTKHERTYFPLIIERGVFEIVTE